MPDWSSEIQSRLEAVRLTNEGDLAEVLLPKHRDFTWKYGGTHFCFSWPPWEAVQREPTHYIQDQILLPPVGTRLLDHTMEHAHATVVENALYFSHSTRWLYAYNRMEPT